jgi:hypothetical protein
MVWNGARRLAVIRRGGRDLDIEVAAGAPEVAALLEPLRVALVRGFAPERSIAVETIAGEPAAESPYRSAFAGFSVTRDARGLRLRRSYTEPAKPARSAP